MSEIVNLRRARKLRDRRAAEAKAAGNRIAHGRTRAERQETEANRALEARKLDQHRREGGDAKDE